MKIQDTVLLQWAQNFLAGGAASGAGERTYSVLCEVARAGYLFCFVRQSKKILCAECSLTVLSTANNK
jgi:hypothetical protein